ncbi:MAG: alkaline phosphatase family protein [Myxococcota bacterium]
MKRRRTPVALALMLACAPPADGGTLPATDVKPAGSRLVLVFAPGLDAATLRDRDLPNLRALSTRKPLQNPVPGHSAAVHATLYTGRPAGEHGVFDGTIRTANSYTRKPARTVRRISAADDRVRPASFNSAIELDLFWKTLGDTGISTSILFAPDLMPLSDLGVRVLAGGLSSLTGERMEPLLFVRPGDSPAEDGVAEMTALSAGVWLAQLPLVQLDESILRSTIVLRERGETVAVRAGERDFELRAGEHSPYLRLDFTAGRRSTVGQTRLHVLSVQPLKVLAEAVTVEPNQPAYPVSVPADYAAQVIGRTGRGPIGDGGAWSNRGGAAYASPEFRAARIGEEAEWRLRAAASELDSTDARVVIVHLNAFSRAKLNGEALAPEAREEARRRRRGVEVDAPVVAAESPSLAAALAALDAGVALLRARLKETDVLLVIGASSSDRAIRGFDLNGWLAKRRYLKFDRDGEVDWEKTQAYSAGEGGIYLNVKGREPEGSVPALRGGRIAKKIAKDLRGLRDRGAKVVEQVWLADEDFAGPGRGAAPDLMVALAGGYALNTSAGNTETLFVDLAAPKARSPQADLDGLVLSSRPLAVDDPKLEDVAVTALVFAGVSGAGGSGRAWFAPPTAP